METRVTVNTDNNSGIFFSHSITENPSNAEHSIHIHDSYELYYFIAGDVTYNIEGQTYKLSPHDLLVINSKELHRPYFDSCMCYERIVVHFNPDIISLFNSLDYNILHYFENRKLGYSNRIDGSKVLLEGIHVLLSQMKYWSSLNNSEGYIMIKTLFIQLLIKLNRIFVDNKNLLISNSQYDEKVLDILEFINQNLKEKISLDLLQKKFFVNKYYLCHMFKKNTGFTVFEYITYKRIMKAKELLKSHIPTTQACSESGFEDYSNFYKVFKKLVGVSPRRFAK